jgi:hypothetical protein
MLSLRDNGVASMTRSASIICIEALYCHASFRGLWTIALCIQYWNTLAKISLTSINSTRITKDR